MTKKGIKRASADVGLIMTAYNLRRLINIIGVETLMKWAIQHLFSFYKIMMLFDAKLAKIKTSILFKFKSIFNFYVSLKPLYLDLN